MIAAGILPVGENSVIKYELIGMNKMKSFEEVFEDKTKYGTKIKTNEYQQEGKYLIVDQGQEQVAGYTNLEKGVFEEVPAIVFGDHTRVIKYVEEPFFLGADGVKVLKCRLPNANYKYLYYTLLNAKIPNTGYNRHFKWLKEIKIAYPNTEKQTEIVCILDKVSKIIEFRQRQLKKLDELVKSRFIEMFGDPALNEKKWDVVVLDNICEGIGDGLHGTPEYDEYGKYPFINGNNLVDGTIEITSSTKKVNAETYTKHYIEIKENALLLSINGTLGKLALYNGEKVLLGKSACYCNLKPEINREFVYSVMKTDAFSEYLNNNATASTIKNVGLKAIRNYKLFMPPENLQIRFAKYSKQVDKSKFVIQQALDKAQLLFDSLMQKYFG